jgi:hypothetical protein
MKHETDRTKKAAKTTANERPLLSSPYELASIAIALAALHQKTEPDLEGAVKLLRAAAMRGQNEKRPIVHYLLSFLESLPEVASKMKEPSTADRKFEDIVSEVEQATVLVLVY